MPVVKYRSSLAYELRLVTTGRSSNRRRTLRKSIPCLPRLPWCLASSHSKVVWTNRSKCTFLDSPQPPAQIRARRVRQVVGGEIAAVQDGVDKGQAGGGTVAHGHRHRAV